MPATTSDNLQLLYEGSVKRVFAAPNHKDRLWFEFSDDYSVFDWGKMPDTIANKGRALAVLGAFFFSELSDPILFRQLKNAKSLAKFDASWRKQLFDSQTYQRLCAKGLSSHFHKLTDKNQTELTLAAAAASAEPIYMEVQKAQIFRPQPKVVRGQPIYCYPDSVDKSERRLVPLEVVFRFGMPEGSSLKERLARQPEYAKQLGLNGPPQDNSFFDRVTLEFFTKLEKKDRLLSIQEAVNISTLSAEQFEDLSDTAVLAACGLFDIFAEKGIELWDGKFEFIFDGRQILLADSIGPDELRLLFAGLQLSKETIRQIYRGSSWEASLKQAQILASERGSLNWKEICLSELNEQPQPLPADFKANIDKLYGVLGNHLIGQALFPGQPALSDLAQALKDGGG